MPRIWTAYCPPTDPLPLLLMLFPPPLFMKRSFPRSFPKFPFALPLFELLLLKLLNPPKSRSNGLKLLFEGPVLLPPPKLLYELLLPPEFQLRSKSLMKFKLGMALIWRSRVVSPAEKLLSVLNGLFPPKLLLLKPLLLLLLLPLPKLLFPRVLLRHGAGTSLLLLFELQGVSG